MAKLPQADFNSNDPAHFAFLDDMEAAFSETERSPDLFLPWILDSSAASRPVPLKPVNGWQALDSDYHPPLLHDSGPFLEPLRPASLAAAAYRINI
jgi:hypothetical protein